MKNSNGKTWKILAILLMAFFAAVTVIYGYGGLNNRVETLETSAEKAEETRERLIRVEEGVEYLKKAVDRIEKKMDE